MKNKLEEITRIDNYEFDERFYQQVINDVKVFAPSVTHILSCTYPSDWGLVQWRGDVGNKRADEILEETSTDGSFVHESIEKILKGEKIVSTDISTMFSPKRSLKIKRCLQAFLDWAKEYQPKVISTEYIIWNDKEKYAGTVDLKCQIGEEIYLVDFKTSKTIHSTHKVQISAYGMADTFDKVALLHLGNTTKKKYSFLVLDDEDRKKYEQEFNQVNTLFKVLHPNAKPTEETFPEVFTL